MKNQAPQNHLPNIYRPPPHGNANEFINILSQKIDSIHNYTNHDIFILGDININFLQNSSPGVKEAKALANTYGMLPLIKELVGEGDEPLYPGASITKAQSLLMNAIFFLRNGLKKKTVQDFLTIYNAQFPHMSPTNYL